jgi:hypothetical protein
MGILSDEMLLDVYIAAIQARLEAEFIQLIVSEMRRRQLQWDLSHTA